MPSPHRSRLKIVVAVFGILVAGAPLILCDAWLDKQGGDEVAATSAWAMGSAEIQIGQTVAVLRNLSARTPLKSAHLEYLATFGRQRGNDSKDEVEFFAS